MKIEVFSDFACPFCYIGKKRLEQAIQELSMENEVELVFKAYQLNPEADKIAAVPFFNASEKMDKQQEKIEAVLAHAAEVGLSYNFNKVLIGNTENAHRLAKWAKKYQLEAAFVEEMMHRYFSEGLNVNDFDELLSVVEFVGLPKDEAKRILENPNEFQEELAQDRYDIQQIPVTSVPFFIFENRFGIKGAEPLRIFKETLAQTAEYLKEKQPKLQMQGSTGASCGIFGCD